MTPTLAYNIANRIRLGVADAIILKKYCRDSKFLDWLQYINPT